MSLELEKKFDLITDFLPDWERMLELFSKASGMTSSLYLPDRTRVAGPYAGSAFGKFLVDSGLFAVDELAHTFEAERSYLATVEKKFEDLRFKDGLTVKLLPILSHNQVLGVVVFGWYFDHFPDPVECFKLSKVFKQPETAFWQAASVQAPTSREKATNHAEMLSLLCSTLTQQLTYLKHATVNARLKDELLAVVSHELKTPLTSILLRVQMLKKNGLQPEKLMDFAHSLESNALVQVKLIEDLLDAAKVITGKFKIEFLPIDLKTVVLAAVNTVEASASKKDIAILTTGLDASYPFMGDGFRLQQAFWNVLANSVKFSSPGGKIHVSLTQNVSSYVIKIQDHGQGIEPSFMPFLFNKFSQHESEEIHGNGGLGLGLSLVKTIIELHHGTVEVESAGAGKGSTFQINLPRTAS